MEFCVTELDFPEKIFAPKIWKINQIWTKIRVFLNLQGLIWKIRAASNIDQKGYFFEKKRVPDVGYRLLLFNPFSKRFASK